MKPSTDSSHSFILSVTQKSTHLTLHIGFTSTFFKGYKSSQCTIKKGIPAKTLLQIQAKLHTQTPGKPPDSGAVALPPAPQPGGAELRLCCFPGAARNAALSTGTIRTQQYSCPSSQSSYIIHMAKQS